MNLWFVLQVIIIPCGITAKSTDEDRRILNEKADKYISLFKAANIRVKCDDRENYSPPWKFNHWELKVLYARTFVLRNRYLVLSVCLPLVCVCNYVCEENCIFQFLVCLFNYKRNCHDFWIFNPIEIRTFWVLILKIKNMLVLKNIRTIVKQQLCLHLNHFYAYCKNLQRYQESYDQPHSSSLLFEMNVVWKCGSRISYSYE